MQSLHDHASDTNGSTPPRETEPTPDYTPSSLASAATTLHDQNPGQPVEYPPGTAQRPPQQSSQPASLVARMSQLCHAFVTPPDLWNKDRPSLKKQWEYAYYGQHVPDNSLARFLSVAYHICVVTPVEAWLWVVQQSSHLAVAAAVLWAASLFDPTRAVLTALLAFPYYIIVSLTNF